MLDTDNPRAVAGHNNPPEPTPMEAARVMLADLDLEASGWFDGEPITNEGQADDVARLLDAARKARLRFDADRKAEKKPHDDAGKAVDAAWKPMIADAERIEKVAKVASTKWLVEQDRVKRERERLAREASELAAAEARRLAEVNDGTLTAAKARDAAIEEAEAKAKLVSIAESAKAQAKGDGMTKAVSLRTTWCAEVTDRRALLNHVALTRPADLAAWLDDWAARKVRGGARDLPGVNVWAERAAA